MQNKPRNGRPGTGRPNPGTPMRTGRPYGRPEARSNANPRLVAVNVLNDVLQKEAYAAMSLDDRLSGVNLNQLDRRLCASIVYRTLENLYYLDFALSGFLRDADALDMTVRNILRTGACQILLHDRVPNSAAVNEAVKLTRELRLDGFSGMVNAVLRRLAEHSAEIEWPEENEGARYLSVMYSMPEWLAQRLIDDYGAEEARRIADIQKGILAISSREKPYDVFICYTAKRYGKPSPPYSPARCGYTARCRSPGTAIIWAACSASRARAAWWPRRRWTCAAE